MGAFRRTEAYRDWVNLPRKTRRRVLQLARGGQGHPDPETARRAKQWADDFLLRSNRRIVITFVGEIFVLVLLYVITHPLFGVSGNDIVGIVPAPLVILLATFAFRSEARKVARANSAGRQ